MSEGWIKLYRKSFENFLYQESRPLTRREAWEDILLLVNHSEGEVLIGNKKHAVKPGQSVRSLQSWARHFRWSKPKVKRFFDLLQNESMIVLENLHKTTRLTVCNWDSYQGDRNAKETEVKRQRNGSETLPYPNKNGENEKNNLFPESIYSIRNPTKEKVKQWKKKYGYPKEFEDLFNLSDTRADKIAALTQWVKLSESERKKVKEHWPEYTKLTTGNFQKYFRTYLSDLGWETDLESLSKNSKQKKIGTW